MKNKQLIKNLLDDINKTRKILNAERLLRDQNDMITEKGANNIQNITYKKAFGRENYLFDNNLNYSLLIDKLLEQREFSFLLYDKSIIQFEYQVQNDKIIKERLVFIKKHNKVWKKQEIENAELTSDEWFDDTIGFPIVLRIDYDEEHYESLLHPKVHFTISNHEHCRIPVKSFIPISDFMQFVLYHFYALDINFNNNISFPSFLSTEEKKVFHFDW